MVGSSQECIDWLKIMSSSLVRRGRIPSLTVSSLQDELFLSFSVIKKLGSFEVLGI